MSRAFKTFMLLSLLPLPLPPLLLLLMKPAVFHCAMPHASSHIIFIISLHFQVASLYMILCRRRKTKLSVYFSHALAICAPCHLIGWCQPLNWYSSQRKRPPVSLLFDLITKVNWRAECRSDHVRNSFGNRETPKITVNKLSEFYCKHMCEHWTHWTHWLNHIIWYAYWINLIYLV